MTSRPMNRSEFRAFIRAGIQRERIGILLYGSRRTRIELAFLGNEIEAGLSLMPRLSEPMKGGWTLDGRIKTIDEMNLFDISATLPAMTADQAERRAARYLEHALLAAMTLTD